MPRTKKIRTYDRLWDLRCAMGNDLDEVCGPLLQIQEALSTLSSQLDGFRSSLKTMDKLLDDLVMADRELGTYVMGEEEWEEEKRSSRARKAEHKEHPQEAASSPAAQ